MGFVVRLKLSPRLPFQLSPHLNFHLHDGLAPQRLQGVHKTTIFIYIYIMQAAAPRKDSPYKALGEELLPSLRPYPPKAFRRAWKTWPYVISTVLVGEYYIVGGTKVLLHHTSYTAGLFGLWRYVFAAVVRGEPTARVKRHLIKYPQKVAPKLSPNTQATESPGNHKTNIGKNKK